MDIYAWGVLLCLGAIALGWCILTGYTCEVEAEKRKLAEEAERLERERTTISQGEVEARYRERINRLREAPLTRPDTGGTPEPSDKPGCKGGRCPPSKGGRVIRESGKPIAAAPSYDPLSDPLSSLNPLNPLSPISPLHSPSLNFFGESLHTPISEPTHSHDSGSSGHESSSSAHDSGSSHDSSGSDHGGSDFSGADFGGGDF